MTPRETAAFFLGAAAVLEGFGVGDVDEALRIIKSAMVRTGCWQEVNAMAPEVVQLFSDLRSTTGNQGNAGGT
jgi:hypothetical protein